MERRQLLSTTYYVSPAGKDTNPGTSTDKPFLTLAAVNALSLQAGDQVLLAGGATFDGTLALTAADAGTAADPITIGSYGTGVATIAAGGGDGIDVTDTGGVNIANLTIVGTSAATAGTTTTLAGSGIQLTNDLAGDVKLQHVYISDVDVSGFGFVGIGIAGTTDGAGGGSGFQDVRITDSQLHGNVEAGLFTYAGNFTANPAPYGLAHSDLYVGHVAAYDNAGVAGTNDSGSGIKLGNVDGATVEHSVAYDNGKDNTSYGGGPVGIWAFNSNAVVIQYNESYDNTAVHRDGGGFDFDGGMTNSTIQYNYSHDNAGAGILLCQFAGASPWSGNVARYNISQNDGRKSSYAAINLWTASGAPALTDSLVYGNTVYLSAVAGSSPMGLLVDAVTDSVAIYNNIFDVAPSLRPVVITNNGVNATTEGNDYWTGSANDLNLYYRGTAYDTLAAYQAASGKEMLNGTSTGFAVDPGLADAGAGSTVGLTGSLASSLLAYQLTAASPLIDAGVSLTALGIDPGPTDFFGTSLPQGNGFDIGAAERLAGSAVTPTPTATTTVAVAVSPGTVVATGTAVTFTATVASSTATLATGTVNFTLADGTVIGTGILGADGTTVVSTTALPAGVAMVTATYAGDADHTGSTATAATITSNNPGLASTVTRSTVPTAVVAGASHVGGKVTLAIVNAAGGTYSNKATIELWASTDGSLDSSAVSVTSVVRGVKVRSDRPTMVTIPVKALPATLAAGTYFWIARITNTAHVASISPAGPSFTASAAEVSLSATVRSSALPPAVVIGRRVGKTVGLSVTNSGNTATTGPLTVKLYLSADGTLATAVAVGTAKSKAVVHPSGATVRLSVLLSPIPTSVAAGSYSVLAVVTDAVGNTAMVTLPASLAVSAS